MSLVAAPLPLEILLVEDNDGDIELTQIAFEEEADFVHLATVHDGAEAIDYLCKRDAYRHVATPSLILLDINMPRMDGMEFLKIVKQDDQLKTIPVIMLTSSDAPFDVTESYRLHANSYILKPRRVDESIQMAKRIIDFWIKLAELPPRPNAN